MAMYEIDWLLVQSIRLVRESDVAPGIRKQLV